MFYIFSFLKIKGTLNGSTSYNILVIDTVTFKEGTNETILCPMDAFLYVCKKAVTCKSYGINQSMYWRITHIAIIHFWNETIKNDTATSKMWSQCIFSSLPSSISFLIKIAIQHCVKTHYIITTVFSRPINLATVSEFGVKYCTIFVVAIINLCRLIYVCVLQNVRLWKNELIEPSKRER